MPVYKRFNLSGDRYQIKLPIVRDIRLDESWDIEPMYQGGTSAVVTPDSTPVLRNAVEHLAWYFKREFRYDFVQYDAADKTEDGHVAFLWADRETAAYGKAIVFGACCFRYREWTNVPAGYALQWIWLHPYKRTEGYLTRAWPYFQARFPGFLPEPPFSRAMDSFLRKMNCHPFPDE